MIYKAIDGSIKNRSLDKLRLSRKGFEWYGAGGIISSYGHNMIYILLKSISKDTRIGVSNLKDEI